MTWNANSMADSESATSQSLPLVSVVVITYNSAKYIIETLESIKSQTYGNIELVVSDDCSSDKTVEIVKDWISRNGQFFAESKLVATVRNSGVAINCNNGLSHTSGTWVKLIAGDDILEPSAIKSYLDFVSYEKGARVVISNCTYFGMKSGRSDFPEFFGSLTAKGQLKCFLVYAAPSFGPTGFALRETLLEVGGYDERYPMIEDVPMSLRLHSNNVKIYLLSECLVRYRISSSGISSGDKFGDRFWDMLNVIVLPYIKKNHFFAIYAHYKMEYFLYRHRKNGLFGHRLFRYFVRAFDYYAWRKYIFGH